MKNISKQCFYVTNLLKTIKYILFLAVLNILDVNEYVDFENQTIEKQYITLSGCTNNRSFIKGNFWKMVTNSYVYKIRNLITFDCRFQLQCIL